MTIYSGISIPISFAIFVLALIPDNTLFSLGTNFFNAMTILFLGSGSIAILSIGIPYVSNLAIDRFLSVGDVWSIVWYHAVLVATVGFNVGATGLYYYYADILI